MTQSVRPPEFGDKIRVKCLNCGHSFMGEYEKPGLLDTIFMMLPIMPHIPSGPFPKVSGKCPKCGGSKVIQDLRILH